MRILTKYKKYFSFFRLRFSMGLQYRTAALAGIVTQFAWGFMEIKVFSLFYNSNAEAFPMTFEQLAAYVWIQQAFLAFFMTWFMENEIFDSIIDGNIAYELCRPVDIYNMWFARSAANRMSRAMLRCFPILIVAAFLPAPYTMTAPCSLSAFLCFVLTMILGLMVTVAICMVIYMLTFFTISPMGLRIFFVSMIEFFQGAVIPINFFPPKLQKVMELLPFASMQNVPLRIYGGNISGNELIRVIALQVFWLAALMTAGKLICARAMKKTAVQGG